MLELLAAWIAVVEVDAVDPFLLEAPAETEWVLIDPAALALESAV